MISPLLTGSYNEHHVFVRWSTKYKKAIMALVTSVRRRRDEVPRVSPHYETESLSTSCREVPSSNGEREPRKWIWPKSFFFMSTHTRYFLFSFMTVSQPLCSVIESRTSIHTFIDYSPLIPFGADFLRFLFPWTFFYYSPLISFRLYFF